MTTTTDELGRVFDSSGTLTRGSAAPKLLDLDAGCTLCTRHGRHYGDHWIPEQLTRAERVGERLGQWLEEQGYASPGLAELGEAALVAVEAHA